MRIDTFTFNPFQENTYVLSDDTKECIIVDPGCYDLAEEKELLGFIELNKLKPVRLINTHAHIDHIFGNKLIAETFKLELELHPLDLPILAAANMTAKKYGLSYTESPEATKLIKEGDIISFGNTQLEILHIPGHAPGHVVFLNNETKDIIGGDVLFRGSIGRTDLPGGNHEDLIEHIKNKLFVLDDEVKVYPGHGPLTTIGYEKKNNPFF